jgi:hypothetical protein
MQNALNSEGFFKNALLETKNLLILKVVGNEKGGGSGSKLLLGYGFGPWRSMSV